MRAAVAVCCAVLLSVTAASADPLNCDISGYRTVPGLAAVAAPESLTLTWDGEAGQQVRMQFGVESGGPVIREIAARERTGQWRTIGTNLKPEYRIVSGIRRITSQQLSPLRGLGVEITPEIIDKYKWEAFWDAPLTMAVPGRVGGPGGGGGAAGRAGAAGPAGQPAAGRAGAGGPAGQAGGGARGQGDPEAAAAGGRGNQQPWPAAAMLSEPRSPSEVKRASAIYRIQGCTVKTNGTHLEVAFPGVSLGVFPNGRLQYTVYKGSNLIRQEIVARTSEPSVAYKYDTGLSGFQLRPSSRFVWRDKSNLWQAQAFGGARNENAVPLKTANRTLVLESQEGSIAAFPPPHSFFWAREVSINLGYNWYQRSADGSVSFGIRQPEMEDASEDAGNFALYSARPGTDQRMPLYLYVSAGNGQAAMQGALALTRQDKYKALPGYQVMATHFHTSPVSRANQIAGLDTRLEDFDLARSAGINIFGPIGAGGGGGQGGRLEGLARYYELAKRNFDKNFLVMPNEEGNAGNIGGHNDVLISKPTFWDYERPAGTPFVEMHPKYGKVYHVGGPEDMVELAKLENMLIYMPHPRSKGSTGYPDAIKDSPAFNHDHYRGIGMRWGMGLDGSETRLCEIRCQTLLDDMNNWMADRPGQLKYVQAITETYQNHVGDDFYANSPVNYVKVATLPGPDNWSPIIDAMKRGDYFWSSGEVLITNYEVRGTGAKRTIVADVEWTFPLAFVEVVWGDGKTTNRQVISTTDLAAHGSKHFEIPFDATGKKWVRFAAWDTATNGAMVMPIRVQP